MHQLANTDEDYAEIKEVMVTESSFKDTLTSGGGTDGGCIMSTV